MSDFPLWERIKGHDETVGLLRGVIDKGRPAHAYLFYGPRGVGKSLTARMFAAALNCPTACGRCVSCRAILNQAHPDFLFIEPGGEQHILLKQIQGLIKSVNLKKQSADHKVALIDDADMMNIEAANAFLKTLEEPPPGVIFILITGNPGQVLPTVASRCQHIRFNPLEREIVRNILVGDQGIGLKDADLAAGLSRGAVGEALEMARGGLLEKRHELRAVLTSPAAAVGRRLELAAGLIADAKTRTLALKKAREKELADFLEAAGGKKYLSGIEKELAKRHKREAARLEHGFYKQVLALVGSIYRDLLLSSQNVDKNLLVDAESIAAGEITLSAVQRAVKQIDRAKRRLERNVSPQLVFEDLFLTI